MATLLFLAGLLHELLLLVPNLDPAELLEKEVFLLKKVIPLLD